MAEREATAHRRASALVAQLTGTHEAAAAAAPAAGVLATPTAAGGLPGPDANVHYGGLLAAQALQEQGVKFTFTLTGGHIAPILVGCESVGIRVVDVRDEATTVFAADAVSRLTGIPGVAIVTAGPGLTNTMTAVKNASLAQVPVVLFAGATAMILKGRGSLQDIDQLALMRSAVKQSWSISSVREIIPTIRRAFRVAQEGVPGPVFVEFPIEILWPQEIIAEQIGVKGEAAPFTFTKASLMEHVKSFYLRRHIQNVFQDGFAPLKPLTPSELLVPSMPVPGTSVSATAKYVARARRPIMLLGSQAIKGGPVGVGGGAGAAGDSHVAQLVRSIEALGIPVFLSGMARGLLGRSHPLLLRHHRSKILRRADLVLLVGVPADFRLDYGKHIPTAARFVAVNLSSTTLNKNNDIRRPDQRVQADPAEFVKALAKAQGAVAAAAVAAPAAQATAAAAAASAAAPSASSSSSANQSLAASRAEWMQFVQSEQIVRERSIDSMANMEASSSKSPVPDAHGQGQGQGHTFVNPLRLCRIIDELLPENTRIIADGGDFVGTASYTVKPRQPLSWLDPGVFGTLGVGAGFALAAALVHPQDTTVILYGDGASGYGLIEFDTYVRMKTPIIAIIGNDACWSQMYRDQIRLLKSAVATELAFTHYEKVAEGLGAKGLLVRAESEMAPAMQQALEWTKQGHSVLINCMIAKSGFREGSISL